jgi:hypothetical protein
MAELGMIAALDMCVFCRSPLPSTRNEEEFKIQIGNSTVT